MALLASGEPNWQAGCAGVLLANGADVHTASRGQTAINLMHKHTYDYIVMDDSLSDMSVLELSLYVPDLAPNDPVLLIACDEWARFKTAWRRCNAAAAGGRATVLDTLRKHLQEEIATRGMDHLS